jgi:hypothetical protein
MKAPTRRVKITIPLENDHAEILWANEITSLRFEIDNIPYFAYELSLGDIVEAKSNDSGVLTFTRTLIKKGNHTIRLLFKKSADTPKAKKLLGSLVEMGCGFEGAKRRLVAVNVPSSVLLNDVVEMLNKRSDLEWESGD